MLSYILHTMWNKNIFCVACILYFDRRRFKTSKLVLLLFLFSHVLLFCYYKVLIVIYLYLYGYFYSINYLFETKFRSAWCWNNANDTVTVEITFTVSHQRNGRANRIQSKVDVDDRWTNNYLISKLHRDKWIFWRW